MTNQNNNICNLGLKSSVVESIRIRSDAKLFTESVSIVKDPDTTWYIKNKIPKNRVKWKCVRPNISNSLRQTQKKQKTVAGKYAGSETETGYGSEMIWNVLSGSENYYFRINRKLLLFGSMTLLKMSAIRPKLSHETVLWNCYRGDSGFRSALVSVRIRIHPFRSMRIRIQVFPGRKNAKN